MGHYNVATDTEVIVHFSSLKISWKLNFNTVRRIVSIRYRLLFSVNYNIQNKITRKAPPGEWIWGLFTQLNNLYFVVSHFSFVCRVGP